MMTAMQTAGEYELFIFQITKKFPSVQRSTLTFFRRGTIFATVTGTIFFKHDFRLTIRERIQFRRTPISIQRYGYEGWQGSTKLYWYDSQPHPHIAALQSTHPHHKHIPPDIKHNRIPAPNLSFDEPNLPFLIQEMEALISLSKNQ